MKCFWALSEKFKEFTWDGDDRRIRCNNIDLVLKLRNNRFCFNRLFSLFFGFSEAANDLVTEISRFPGILPGFPKVLDRVVLFPSSVIALELYYNLLSCKPCWELQYPKYLLSRIWLDPGYFFDDQINGVYLLPAVIRKGFSRKQVLDDSYKSYLYNRITKLFKKLLLSYSSSSFLTELSYQALNPEIRLFIKRITRKALKKLTPETFHKIKSALTEFLFWIDLSDVDFLKLLL